MWFPAQSPPNPCDSNSSHNDTASLSSNSQAREGGGGVDSTGGARHSISSNRSNSSVLSGIDTAGSALDRTRARYGGGAQDTGAGSTRAGGGGGGGGGGRETGSALDHGDGGSSRNSSNNNSTSSSSSSSSIARGLLFEVREFYGPTRIVVELVSGSSAGGGSVGGGGGTGGGNGGGTVFGSCEARLAEALVGRGGGSGSSSSSSTKLQRASNFGLGKGEPAAFFRSCSL